MSPELRLHGRINDDIEYFATAAGCQSAHQHFYEISDGGLRLFAPGSELILDGQGVKQKGRGGYFCEYMFGVEQPLPDLIKKQVHNRLVLLGANYDNEGRLRLTTNTNFEQSYVEIFHQGHAIDNFYFFIDGLKADNLADYQHQIIKYVGKALKYQPTLNQLDDSKLSDKLKHLLPKGCSVFLIRLSHSKARHFQQEYQRAYYTNKNISTVHQTMLDELAENLGLTSYQKERIGIDVMYRHRDNYRIIDEYKSVLVDCYQQGEIDRQNYARLTRLKTLALRDEIPLTLLNTLDNKLHPRISQIDHEPEYTAITRDILQELKEKQELSKKDLIQLLHAKQKARRHHDNAFEQLLLETGKHFDECIRDGAPLSLLEDFSRIITLFDRYDSSSTNVSRIAFMENFRTSVEWLDKLLQNRAEFNKLEKDLFQQLFFSPLNQSPYLTRYGRQKLEKLQKGLEEIAAGVLTSQHLNAEVKVIETQEETYKILYTGIRNRIQKRYFRFDTKEEISAIYQDLNQELQQRGVVKNHIDQKLFQDVIYDIKKEVFYLRNLLPEIISTKNQALRYDFLTNSGLDIFHIEELENEYISQNGLDQECLKQLRAGQ